MTAVVILKSDPFNNPTSGDSYGNFLSGGYQGSNSLVAIVVAEDGVFTDDVFEPGVF
jgi:hypothetical protein